MQFLYDKKLGKIWCGAVLKALTTNNDIRIELQHENSLTEMYYTKCTSNIEVHITLYTLRTFMKYTFGT